MFGSKDDARNSKVRDQLERSGGRRAWALILDCKSRYQTGAYSVVPTNQADHVTLTLRVEPENDAPFQTTARAVFSTHRPRRGGSIGVIFDPADHSKLAVYPQWAFSPESAGRPRTQEMIAAFLERQARIPDAPG
jgi:hypothetical protein